jgi:hypothetical protein
MIVAERSIRRKTIGTMTEFLATRLKRNSTVYPDRKEMVKKIAKRS